MTTPHIDELDSTDRPVLALAKRYEHGTLLPWHAHRRAQWLYGATGIMHVQTAQDAWIVPPQQAVWIPAQVPHQVHMLGVTTHSLYIEPARAPRHGATCEVLSVSTLLQHLLAEAVHMPVRYDEHGRDGALVELILHEVAASQPLPYLHIPLPQEPRLAALCTEFLNAPDIHRTAQDWSHTLHMSLRSFGRHFGAQTGLSFQDWRQRACVVHALSRLAQGEAVTTIALDMGYDSPGAFSTMFARVVGKPPSSMRATA